MVTLQQQIINTGKDTNRCLADFEKAVLSGKFSKYTSARDAVFIRSHRYKRSEKTADRNRTHLTFYSEIIKQKNRNGSIHFPYNHFKHKTVQKRAQNLSLQDRENIRHTLQESEKLA